MGEAQQGLEPTSIVEGPDGNLWFTEFAADAIGMFDPTTSTFAQYAIPPDLGSFLPDSITKGPDGNLWFVGQGSNMIGEVAFGTDGPASLAFPTSMAGTGSYSIAEGPGGVGLWFTQIGVAAIGSFTPGTAYSPVIEHAVSSDLAPVDIAPGPDANLYFTAGLAGDAMPDDAIEVDQITTAGTVTRFEGDLTANSDLGGIAAGPEGNVYFTEAAGDRIGQVVLPQTSLTSFSGSEITPTQGQLFSGTVATFTEASPVATTVNFYAEIDWGDGTPTDVVATTESDGVFRVEGSHTYPAFGPYGVTVTVFNASGSRSILFLAYSEPAISATGLPIEVTAGRAFTLPVADFTDAGAPRPPDSYLLAINWGDGTTSAGTLGIGPGGQLEVIGTHAYAAPGQYGVSTEIGVAGDPDLVGGSLSNATVTPAPPVLVSSPAPIAAVAGQPFEGAVAFVIDTSPAGLAGSTYAASIDWGDGTPLSGGTIVPVTADSFAVVGSHVYASAGAFPVDVIVVKAGTLDSTSTSGVAEVSAAPPLSFVVTNTNDSGPGSLRQVILNANSVGGHEITFAIPAQGTATIGIDSPLPPITGPTVIDGPSQAAFEGETPSHPLVEVDGLAAGGGDGLAFGAGSAGSLLFSVDVFGFSGAQVMIGAADVTLLGDVLGLRADGSVPPEPGGVAPPASFANAGVEVSAPGAVIGGLAPGEGNLISGNSGYGVLVDQSTATMVQVVGNLIGVDPTGTVARPNELDGVGLINGANHEFIGPGNVISGNLGNGVGIHGGSGDLIAGNTIGTDFGRDREVGNGDYGIDVDQGAGSILIGGTAPTSGNLVSGNAVVGVGIQDGSTVILVESNEIGTDGTGERAIGNGIAGVLVSDSPANVVGPGNLVSGNGTNLPGAGIWVDGPGSTFNLIAGNKVGTDATGRFAIPNTQVGILINQASGNEVGGDSPGAGNVVSGNASVGVMIAGPNASRNLIAGNLVGTDASGSAALGNGSSTLGGAGVYIDNASGNAVGGPGGLGNLISGNNFDGVQVYGPASMGTLIEGNGVGVDLSGTARLGNGDDGLLINGAPDATILGNLVGANGLDGITASGAGATGTLIQQNTIGRGIGGQPLGNGTFGVLVINEAPMPTLAGNVNVNNADGPIRNTGLAAPSPAVSTKSAKVAVAQGRATPSGPSARPKAKKAGA